MTDSCSDWALWLVTAAHLSDRQQKADLHFFFPFLRTLGQVRLHPTIFAMPAMYGHGSHVAPQKFLGLVLNGLNIRKGKLLNYWSAKWKGHQLVLLQRDFQAGLTCFNALVLCCFMVLILPVPEVYWLCAPPPDAWPGKELYRSGNSCWKQKFAFMQASIYGAGMLWQRPGALRCRHGPVMTSGGAVWPGRARCAFIYFTLLFGWQDGPFGTWWLNTLPGRSAGQKISLIL